MGFRFMKSNSHATTVGGRVRLGLLGCSRIANRIINAAPLATQIVIAAIASRSREKAMVALSQLPNAIATHDYDELLSCKEIDAVYISIPNSLHFEWALKAISNGKHVLVEKPAAMSVEQLEELGLEAEKAGVVIMEAMWYRYHGQIKFLRDLTLSRSLGKLQAVSGSFCFQTKDPDDIRWSAELGGGAIADLFCYHADLLTHVLGIRQTDIASLEAFARYRNDVPASVYVEMNTGGGTVISLAASIERRSSNLTSLIYERGSCVAPNLRAVPEIDEVELRFTGLEPNRKMFVWENAYANMVDAFALGVGGQREQLVSLDDSIANLQLMNSIQKACQVEMADRIALIPKLASKSAQLRRRIFGT
jgi:xylose dehydrogenase (NAD/NADP)